MELIVLVGNVDSPKKVKLTNWQALARGPVQLPASKDVDVQVVDRLAPIHSIVDDHSIALFKTLFLGNFPGSEHEVTQKVAISILSLLNHRDSLSRNHKKVHRSLRCYIIECNTLVILVDERGRDGAIQDLVKDRSLLRHGSSEAEPLLRSVIKLCKL